MKNEFTRLKRKIFLRVLLIVLIALIVGIFMQYLLIDGILQAPFADGFISVCKHVNVTNKISPNKKDTKFPIY